jgi:hypothetical protein
MQVPIALAARQSANRGGRRLHRIHHRRGLYLCQVGSMRRDLGIGFDFQHHRHFARQRLFSSRGVGTVDIDTAQTDHLAEAMKAAISSWPV